MASFLNQDRCRVCGRMFCCREHQFEHERIAHFEWADWLDVLPALCCKCHRTVTNIHEMNGNCIQFNVKNAILKKERVHSLAVRPSGKRTTSIDVRNLDDEQSAGIIPDATLVELRKKTAASRRPRKQMSPVVLIEIKNRNDIISTVFSPLFNVSQNILSGGAKTSTPLRDEKKCLPVVAFFDKIDMSMYETPPSTARSGSLVVVSALKKLTTRQGINLKSVKKSDSRRVTFEMAQTTPEMELRSNCARSRRNGNQRELTINFKRVENDENSEVETSAYDTLESDVEPMVQSSDAKAGAAVVTPPINFRAFGWSMQIIRKQRNDATLPVRSTKRKYRPLRL